MLIKLTKASGKSKCRHQNCRKLPTFINEDGYIIKDTVCGVVTITNADGKYTTRFCKDCCQRIHDEMRKTFNMTLLAFQ